MRARLAFLRLVRAFPFEGERMDLPGIHDLLVQARHALRPRRNPHDLAIGAVCPSLVWLPIRSILAACCHMKDIGFRMSSNEAQSLHTPPEGEGCIAALLLPTRLL